MSITPAPGAGYACTCAACYPDRLDRLAANIRATTASLRARLPRVVR